MSEQPVMLKILLREKHWQNYSTFCAEYDKAARRIDPDLAGHYPSRAQLHRWLTGAVRGVPYADHCRVLEEMFPGWTAEQLFQPLTGERPLTAPGGAVIPPASVVLSTGLRPYIEHAFTAEHVIIDFAGFSGETLHGVLQEPLDKIRLGQLVAESVEIRVLVPDPGQPWAIPCRVADLGDEPAFRERAEQISRRHTDALTETVAELADLGLVGSASAEVRMHGGTPTFKLYILNGSEAFFGFYPLTEHTVALDGQPVPMYDLMGKDVTTFHYEKGDDPADIGGQFVEQAQAWFDSIWATISRPSPIP